MAGHLRLLQDLQGTRLSRELRTRLLLMVPCLDNITKTHPTLKRVQPMKAPKADGTFMLLFRLHYPSFGPKDYSTALLEGVMQEAKALGVDMCFTQWEDFGWTALDIYPEGLAEAVGEPTPSSLLPNVVKDEAEFRAGAAQIRETYMNSTTEEERNLELFRLRRERRALYEAFDRLGELECLHEDGDTYEGRLAKLDAEIEILVAQEAEAAQRPKLVVASFFCPGCGCRLYREPQAGADHGPYPVECVNSKCLYSFPHAFTVHHPFHGIDNGPGDSWSLSFVK